MNKELKFRQRLSDDTWHYWGFIQDGRFVSPVLNSETYQDAIKHSQQFTELIDKNKNEVWVGDIVKHPYYPNTGVVEWMGYNPNGVWIGHYVVTDSVDESIEIPSYDIEVIGNIYQNSERIPLRIYQK